MIPKPLKDISFSDLQALYDEGAQESKTLEYKRNLPGNSDSTKDDFRAEVSAMANTVGGDLIFGVEDGNGRPKALAGAQVDNIDDEILRLSQILSNGLHPRLPHIDIVAIAAPDSRTFFLVRVPHSWAGPHRVREYGKFYARNSAGKYPMDVGELRTAFTLSESISERVRTFRKDRVNELWQRDGNLFIEASGKPHSRIGATILHIIPLSAFAGATNFDLFGKYDTICPGILPRGGGANFRINLDGILAYESLGQQPPEYFTQIYRNGVIESFRKQGNRDDRPSLPLASEERGIIQACDRYINTLEILGAAPPLYVFYSMFGIKECMLPPGWHAHVQPIDDEMLLFPEVVIRELNSDLDQDLRPLFDMMWNAFGYKGTPSYDEKGERVDKGVY